jgi:hypothetical protein
MDQLPITTWKHPLTIFIDEMPNNGEGKSVSNGAALAPLFN